ncbi:hypothetical protein C1645_837555 [Glomus cerebriforme]|uniref:Uncharacterized protein n=1 Tax=Glomus cerebriforme TaxID=658196 RepID=A0A397S3U9_9GLOM|nr:hypothetical protein C1645_837555 [Glomus cerebriforme]
MGVHVKAFAQMLYQIRDCPQRIISLYNSQKTSEIFQEPNHSLIRAELSALRPIDLPTAVKGHREWIKLLIVMLLITGASLEIISTEGTITNRKIVSNIIKAVEENIKGSDAELIVNTPNITPDDAEDDNWDWDMDDTKWINLCNISFVKKFNNPEPLRHFRRLAYFRRQDSDAIKVLEEVFVQSCERFMEIRNQSLLLFGFKSHVKETPDLKSAIKAINAIAGNWCGYTVKSDKKRIGSKGQQVWQYSYQINRWPYNGTGFGDKGAPELPLYRPKTDNDIQELFDSIG